MLFIINGRKMRLDWFSAGWVEEYKNLSLEEVNYIR